MTHGLGLAIFFPFGLWLIVATFHTIFRILTKQTFNGLIKKTISRFIQNEKNHLSPIQISKKWRILNNTIRSQRKAEPSQETFDSITAIFRLLNSHRVPPVLSLPLWSLQMR